MNFIVCITTNVIFNAKLKIILVECKEQNNNKIYQARLLSDAMSIYIPNINDKILLYRPNTWTPKEYLFAMPLGKQTNNTLQQGEGEIGNINNAIQFLLNKINFKSTEINMQEPTNVIFDSSGTPFLNQNVQAQVVIPTGSSAGTYQVNVINPGQTKVKG